MHYTNDFLEYLEATKNLSRNTLLAYRCDLDQFFQQIPDPNAPDLCSYINYLKTHLQLKDSSIRRKIVTLQHYYSFLADRSVLPRSPFAGDLGTRQCCDDTDLYGSHDEAKKTDPDKIQLPQQIVSAAQSPMQTKRPRTERTRTTFPANARGKAKPKSRNKNSRATGARERQ